MAPFPEAEIMTIKRLEVALRKMDFKLLKDGAYKLHEKYHSGHRFEYLDLLKDIYLEIINNPTVPFDVKDILASTIQDILEEGGVDVDGDGDLNNENENQTRVSNLTSLSYSAPSSVQHSKETEDDDYIKEYLQGPAQTVSQEDINEIFNEEEKYKNNYVSNFNQPQQNQFEQKPIEAPISKEQEERNKAIEQAIGEPRINAFDAFSAPRTKSMEQPRTYFTNSPFSAQPFKEFNYPEEKSSLSEPAESSFVESESTSKTEEFATVPTTFESEITSDIVESTSVPSFTEPVIETIENEIVAEERKEKIDELEQELVQENFEEIEEKVEFETKEEAQLSENKEYIEEIETKTEETVEVQKEKEVTQEEFEELEEKKTIAIFYAQDASSEKSKNILKLNELIKNKDCGIFDIISEIKTQANTNVSEIKGILDNLWNKGHNVKLITNSQSSMIAELFDGAIALYGLTNLFKCSLCEEKYLDKNDGVKSFVLECPKCKKPMFPELYASSDDAVINFEYYNEALITLANSKVWLLIHPTFMDKKASNMLETALRVSKCVEEIYVIDKDINVRETYKNVIGEIRPDAKVSAHQNSLEDFFNNI